MTDLIRKITFWRDNLLVNATEYRERAAEAPSYRGNGSSAKYWNDAASACETRARDMSDVLDLLAEGSVLVLTEKELRLAWLAVEVQVDGNGDDPDVQSLDAKLTTAMGNLPDPDPETIDMHLLAAIVRAKGVECIIEQTGGGTATLFAGGLVGERYAAAAGPGWFEGPNWTLPRAHRAEFCVGPDDMGEADPTYITTETIDQIADLIVGVVNAGKAN